MERQDYKYLPLVAIGLAKAALEMGPDTVKETTKHIGTTLLALVHRERLPNV